jgi:DNA sulfur modification protein DndD
MDIQSLALTNFGSYKGHHVFDFSTNTGRYGYAIFGEIGRGKTTLINSILWSLYGEVNASVELEGRVITQKRPIIDYDQSKSDFSKKWNLPLLNLSAFEENNIHMMVSLKFTHKGSTFELTREAVPRKDNPKKSGDIAVQATLRIDGVPLRPNQIQPAIEEIIPERISRFFFVEVDSIKSYSALLFANESSGGIVEDIEAILGMPALEHSKADFAWLREYQEKRIEGIQTDDKRNQTIKIRLDGIDKTIKQFVSDIQGYNSKIEEETDLIQEIELQLEEQPSTSLQIERLNRAKDERESLGRKLSDLYMNRKKEMSGLAWRILLQKKIESLSVHYSDLKSMSDDLNEKITEQRLACTHINHQISQGGAKCKVCGSVSDGLSEEEQIEKIRELTKKEQEIEQMQKEKESLGNPGDDLISLSNFRDGNDGSVIAEIEDDISRSSLELSDLEEKIKSINKELENIDVLAIRKLQSERTGAIERRGALKDILKDANQVLSDAREERARVAANLTTTEIDTPVMKQLVDTRNMAGWLETVFEQTLENYKENARQSVEALATAAWLNMTPEPERYQGIKINKKWQAQVLSIHGNALPIGNPGHRQTLAVCIFDGLRKTSGRKFPTFYDNPGSNISDVVLKKMADHFWNNTSDQIVMLSHGGGLKRIETMREYGQRLAKAWELTYSESDTTTQISEVLD